MAVLPRGSLLICVPEPNLPGRDENNSGETPTLSDDTTATRLSKNPDASAKLGSGVFLHEVLRSAKTNGTCASYTAAEQPGPSARG